MPKNTAWPNEVWPAKPPAMFHDWPMKAVKNISMPTVIEVVRHQQRIDHGDGEAQRRSRSSTRSHARLPNRPVGLNSRIRMKISEMPIWPSCSPRNRPPSDSVTPMRKPPTAAPDEAAHAAQHDDGEGDQHEGVARLRRDVEGRHQQAGRGAEAGDADAVGDGEDVLDVDADQARALALLGDGADRLAGVALGHEEAEHQRRSAARRRTR